MTHRWEHKETKKIIRVTPWWEIPEGILDDATIKAACQDKLDDFPDRMFKIGALVQVGWLLENEHGMWIGVGPKAKEAFNDLGPITNEVPAVMCTCEASDNVDINNVCMQCGKPYNGVKNGTV